MRSPHYLRSSSSDQRDLTIFSLVPYLTNELSFALEAKEKETPKRGMYIWWDLLKGRSCLSINFDSLDLFPIKEIQMLQILYAEDHAEESLRGGHSALFVPFFSKLFPIIP